MESLFENIYTDTEESTMELGRQIGKGSRWFFIVLFACYTVFFLVAVWAVENILYWAMLFLCAGYLLYLLFLPRIKTKRYFKNMKQHHNGIVPETRVICTEEDITVWFGKNCGHIPYDKITKVCFYKNIICLEAGKVSRAVLLQDAFTKGTKEEFIDFLRMKCPNLKIKLPDWKW